MARAFRASTTRPSRLSYRFYKLNLTNNNHDYSHSLIHRMELPVQCDRETKEAARIPVLPQHVFCVQVKCACTCPQEQKQQNPHIKRNPQFRNLHGVDGCAIWGKNCALFSREAHCTLCFASVLTSLVRKPLLRLGPKPPSPTPLFKHDSLYSSLSASSQTELTQILLI